MRRVLITIAAIVLLVVAFLWLKSGRSDSDTSAVGQSSESGATSDLESSRRARKAGTVNKSLVYIAGRVVAAESGSGIPGATVSLMHRRLDWGGRSEPGQSSEPIAIHTDDTGAFRFVGLRAGTYSVAASAPGRTPGAIDKLPVLSGQSREDIVVELAPGGQALSGVVSDIGGGGIPHAVIQVRRIDQFTVNALFRAPFTTVSDGEGRYSVDLGSGRYNVIALHSDYVRKSDNIEIRDQPRELNFVMTPGGVIEGVVLRRQDETPVEGALVTHARLGQTRGFDVTGIATRAAAVTDAGGRFVVRGLSSGAVELRALAAEVASSEPTVVELGIAESVTDVVVYVDKSFTVSGFVVDARDKESTIPGVMVGAFNLAPGALHAASDPSAGDGYFEIHGVKAGSYTVGALGEERVPSIFGASIEVVDQNVEDVVVTLDPGVTLSGRVQPPAPAQVFLEVDMEKIGLGNVLQIASAVMAQSRASDDGTFVLRGVGSGSFSLVARTDDGREGSIPVQISTDDQTGLVVPLQARATVRGRVVDGRGYPVEGANVVIEPTAKSSRGFSLNSRMSSWGSITDQDGRFESMGHGEGAHTVVVRENWNQLAWADADGDAALEPLPLNVVGSENITDLRLAVESRNQRITGVVLGPTGNPLADAWVTAAHARRGDSDDGDDRERRRRRRRWRPKEPPVLTDETGRFVIDNLRDGSYDLTCEADRGAASGFVDGVAAGTNVTIRLEKLAELHGTVKKAGSPVASYIIEADGPTQRRARVANPDGAYRFTRLQSGQYEIRVTAPQGRTSTEVDIESGEIVEHDMTLVALGSVRGVLVDANGGEPLVGMAVVAGENRAEAMRSGVLELVAGEGPQTDEQGRFRVTGLGAGDGSLFVLDPDSAGFELVASKSYTLSPGQDLDLGTLQGTVTKRVPPEERGQIGMQTQIASWSGRPGDSEETEPPPGLDDEADHLWIASVDPDGPGHSAGARLGDRITAVNGVDVAMVGARIARQMLSDRNLRAGDTVQLSLDRRGNQLAVTIECAPMVDEAPPG